MPLLDFHYEVYTRLSLLGARMCVITRSLILVSSDLVQIAAHVCRDLTLHVSKGADDDSRAVD